MGDIEEDDDENVSGSYLGMSKLQVAKMVHESAVHEVFEQYSDEDFDIWIRIDQYQQLYNYQRPEVLLHMYKFAEKHGYIDKQAIILKQMIRTENYLKRRRENESKVV